MRFAAAEHFSRIDALLTDYETGRTDDVPDVFLRQRQFPQKDQESDEQEQTGGHAQNRKGCAPLIP